MSSKGKKREYVYTFELQVNIVQSERDMEDGNRVKILLVTRHYLTTGVSDIGRA